MALVMSAVLYWHVR